MSPSPKYNDELLFRIPEDYIDSNNYMKHNNILHTELYSDRGRECLTVYCTSLQLDASLLLSLDAKCFLLKLINFLFILIYTQPTIYTKNLIPLQ